MRNSRTASALALGGAALLALTACAEGSAPKTPTSELTPVSFRLDWTIGAEHTGYIVAQALGYYEDAGLDVTIAEGQGSSVTAQALAAGEDEFGVISAGEVLASVSKGLPIESIATVVQHSPTAIVYNTDKLTVESLDDLYGAKLGTVTSSSIYKEWQAVAALTGTDESKIEVIDAGQAIVQALLSGQVDAITGWTFNQGLQAQVEGADVEFLKFSDLGLDIPNSTLAVTTSFAQENPEAVAAFVEATARGWAYVAEHHDESLQMLFDAYPEIDQDYNTRKLPLVQELMGDEFGTFDSTTWEALYQLYADQGLLGEDVDLDGQVYTTEFLPAS